MTGWCEQMNHLFLHLLPTFISLPIPNYSTRPHVISKLPIQRLDTWFLSESFSDYSGLSLIPWDGILRHDCACCDSSQYHAKYWMVRQIWNIFFDNDTVSGSPNTHLIRQKFHKVDWSLCSITKQWYDFCSSLLLNSNIQVAELTGLPTTNASLLDEATACAEAVAMASRAARRSTVLLDPLLHPQNRDVIQTRSESVRVFLRSLFVLENS